MVTSSVTTSSASSHSSQVLGNAHCFCVFGGGGVEMGVGFRAAEGGEVGVGSSHSSWVIANTVVVVGRRGHEGKKVKEVGKGL